MIVYLLWSEDALNFVFFRTINVKKQIINALFKLKTSAVKSNSVQINKEKQKKGKKY